MACAHIRLGDPVFSQDGRKLGHVDRLILDDRRRRVKALVVHKLLQAADKMIEMSQVERVGEDGIHLRITADEAARLPAFVREGFIEVAPEAALHALYAALMPGPGTILAAAPVAGRRTIEEATADTRLSSIPADAKVTVESNVPDYYDVIGTGTDVIAADGRKVGTVAEVMVDRNGFVSGFVIREGFLFTRDVFIPVAWIAEIGSERIRLKVSAEQAEASAQQAPDARLTPATQPGA
jgi:uncharacterized protein YrrD